MSPIVTTPCGIVATSEMSRVLCDCDREGLPLVPSLPQIALTLYLYATAAVGIVCQGICCVKRLRDKRMARYKTLVAHSEMQAALRRDLDAIA